GRGRRRRQDPDVVTLILASVVLGPREGILDGTLLLTLGAVLGAAFIKGTIGMGFPAVATPLLALATDVKTAIVLLLLPNIAMDLILLSRRWTGFETLRRIVPLLLAAIAGTFVGTHLLVTLPAWTLYLGLGAMVLLYVGLELLRVSWRTPPEREVLVGPLAGLASGVLGGMTNAFGPPLVMYFYSVRMEKLEFVRSIALAFLILKVTQLTAVLNWNLLDGPLLLRSLLLPGLALLGVCGGLKVQDAIPQRAFNRAILTFLFVSGLGLLWRAARLLGG
ncbi:MAG: sulfite exporter TauE/SafE family protein, partial [candidate division NC10 bacterium]|nr:sulfite exporter TauE/SafE family protein [candidate division NC10 bacterium]